MTTTVSTAVAEPAAPRRSARRFVPLLAVAVAVAAYAGFRAYQGSRPYEWSGTVEARTISVGSRTGGRVKEVLVREGDRLPAGQPLLTLEPGDLEAQRLQARAQLEQSQANLEKLEKGSRPEEIEEARAKRADRGRRVPGGQAGAREARRSRGPTRASSLSRSRSTRRSSTPIGPTG